MKTFFKAIMGLALLAAFAVSGVLIVKKHQQQMAAKTVETFDIPTQVVAIHANAIEGMVALTPPEELGMKLINAGFPPQRPTLNLLPRANTVGTAVTPIGPYFVSNSLYRMDVDEDRRFSVFLVPANPAFDPSTMGTMRVLNRELRVSNMNGFNVVLWKKHNWYTALVTDLAGRELTALVSLILNAEAKL